MKKIYLLIIVSFCAKAQNLVNLQYNVTDRNGYQCTGSLFINGSENMFVINDPRTEKNNQSNVNPQTSYKLYNDKWSRIFYFNGKEMITRIPLYEKEVVYFSNEVPKNIKFTSGKKIIGKFNCQEALIEKGGRKYSVYFTKDYPKQVGPMGFNFLPGLVVEIRDLEDSFSKVELVKITKESANKTFEDDKKYILAKKPDKFMVYCKNIISLMPNKKRENYALLAKYNATIEYAPDESFYTDHLIDIPENLVKELKKIKE